jgi:hypothetical protein
MTLVAAKALQESEAEKSEKISRLAYSRTKTRQEFKYGLERVYQRYGSSVSRFIRDIPDSRTGGVLRHDS